MKAPLRAICRQQTALGLGLAGIPCIEAADGAEAAAALDELADGPAGGGVILIEQRLLDQLPVSTQRRIRMNRVPILVPLPSPSLAAERERAGEEEVLAILRQAVGYRLRLR